MPSKGDDSGNFGRLFPPYFTNGVFKGRLRLRKGTTGAAGEGDRDKLGLEAHWQVFFLCYVFIYIYSYNEYLRID